MHRTTLKDISKTVGCSVNSVSLALKNSPRISEEMKKQIIRTAKEMDYIPNNAARSLVLGKSRTIGLILSSLHSNFMISEASYIEKILSQMGYSLSIVTSQSNVKTETNAINLMISGKVDGLLINTNYIQNIPRLESLRNDGFPVVLLSSIPERKITVDSVYPDLYAGSYMATKHLLDMGHKRVIYVCGHANVRDALKRNAKAKGFRKAIEDSEIPFSNDMILPAMIGYTNQQMSYGIKISDDLLDKIRHETALFFGEDEFAIPVMKHLTDNNISIPYDIAVSSMDNTQFAESAVVSLTSVGFDTLEIAESAVEMLMQIIKNDGTNKSHQKKPMLPKLYIRDSCGNKS